MKKKKFLTLIKLNNMLNEDIAKALAEKYGTEKFKIYCEMESEKSRLFQNEARMRYGFENGEFEYDAFFWKTKLEEINQNY